MTKEAFVTAPLTDYADTSINMDQVFQECDDFEGTAAEFLTTYGDLYPVMFRHVFDPDTNKDYFSLFRWNAIGAMAEVPDHEVTRKATNTLKDYIPLMIKSLSGAVPDWRKTGVFQTMLDLTSLEFNYAIQNKLRQKLNNAMNGADVELFAPLLAGFVVDYNSDSSPYAQANECINVLLSRSGILKHKYELHSWWRDMQYASFNQYTNEYEDDYAVLKAGVAKNLKSLAGIESRHPGYARHLIDNYNIHSFGRYSEDQLVRQVNNSSRSGEVFMVTVAESDYNGAFSNMTWLAQFAEELERKNIYLRVHEIDSAKSLLKAYSRERAKNTTPPVRGSFHTLHGNEFMYTFSHNYRKKRNSGHKEQISSGFLKTLRKECYVAADPVVILDFCQSDRAIAPHIAGITGIKKVQGFENSIHTTHMYLAEEGNTAGETYRLYSQEKSGAEIDIGI